MACDPATLMDSAKCLLMLSKRQLLASWAYQACNGSPTPPQQGITTDPDGLIITTDDGLVIVPD